MNYQILQGDAAVVLRSLPSDSVHCCVTSPPYWGLRDYRVDHQLGSEPSPQEYIQHLVEILEEVYLVLHPWGTLWLNLGDTYLEKRLLGLPWRVALSLQVRGWWLRNEVVWYKPLGAPCSAPDRLGCTHEKIFLFSKGPHYFFDIYAEHPRQGRDLWEIMPPSEYRDHPAAFPLALPLRAIRWGSSLRGCCTTCLTPLQRVVETVPLPPSSRQGSPRADAPGSVLSPSSVYRSGGVAPKRLKGWQFACSCSSPETSPCTILDPFCGSGTTGVAALQLGRQFIGIDLSPSFCSLSQKRLEEASLEGRLPLFSQEEFSYV